MKVARGHSWQVVDERTHRAPYAPGRAEGGSGGQVVTASPLGRVAGRPDRDYWVSHCDGYVVESSDGRLGVVEEVRRSASGDVLAIRAGRFGRRLLLVPAEEVQLVVPRAERLWLRSDAIFATEPLGG